jgi:carboxymethylenebutenolidase
MVQTLDIVTPDGICDTFVAYPSDQRSFPAVILYMDAFGLREYMYKMAQTLAARGYYVLMPNVLYRAGRTPLTNIKFPLRSAEDMSPHLGQVMALVQNFQPEMAMKDAATLFAFLARQKQVRPGPVGVTGYCMGGGLALRLAESYPEQVAAAACFHAGNLASDKPNSPHLMLNRVKCELYIASADNDKSMLPEQIERLEQALNSAGVKYKSEVYKGAAHGFTMMDLPAGNQAAVDRHWDNLFGLLERNLPSAPL